MQRDFYFCRNLRDLVGQNQTHVLTPPPPLELFMAYNKNRAIANIACVCKTNKSATIRLFTKLAVV